MQHGGNCHFNEFGGYYFRRERSEENYHIYKLTSDFQIEKSVSDPGALFPTQSNIVSDTDGNLYTIIKKVTYDQSSDRSDSSLHIVKFSKDLDTLESHVISDDTLNHLMSLAVSSENHLAFFRTNRFSYGYKSTPDTAVMTIFFPDFSVVSKTQLPETFMAYESMITGDSVITHTNMGVVYFDAQFNQLGRFSSPYTQTLGADTLTSPYYPLMSLSIADVNLFTTIYLRRQDNTCYIIFFNSNDEIVARVPTSRYFPIYGDNNDNIFAISSGECIRYPLDAIIEATAQ